MFCVKSILILFISSNIICDIIDNCNIDRQFPILFTSDVTTNAIATNGTYFGSTLSAIKVNKRTYILIGAPKYNTDYDRSGAIFHFEFNGTSIVKYKHIINNYKTTDEIPTENANLGSSLTTNDTTFVGCAHLKVYPIEDRPGGICYEMDQNGQVSKFIKWSSENNMMFGFSSAGVQGSAKFVISGPGYHYFSGTIVYKSFNWQKLSDLKVEHSYLGYSITTGSFFAQTKSLVMGSPRNLENGGKVILLPLETNDHKNSYNIKSVNKSDSSEYFGASLLAIDINNDKFDDLIVGAPLYSSKSLTDLGRVYIYLSNGKDLNYFMDIDGHHSYSRFGTSLSSVDINSDGFNDVVIGAPFEKTGKSQDSEGAIYIYYGTKSGLESKSPIRIGAEVFNLNLRGFGISIVSNIDFDNNGYNDLLIGSYLSENAVLLRTKPIAELFFENITITPNKIDINAPNCDNSLCFNVSYCVGYSGERIRSSQTALVSIQIIDNPIIKETRITTVGPTDKFLLISNITCSKIKDTFQLIISKPDALKDITTPMEFKLTLQLNHTNKQFCKDCAVAKKSSNTFRIDFDHNCKNMSEIRKCISLLNMSTVLEYNRKHIQNEIIEGIDKTINAKIEIINGNETSIGTVLFITINPIKNNVTLQTFGDSKRCKQNGSTYVCQFTRILRTHESDKIDLKFNANDIQTNHLEFNFKVESNSSVHSNSKTTSQYKFKVIRRANLTLAEVQSNNFSYVELQDKNRREPIKLEYTIEKFGPSTIDTAFLIIHLPNNIIVIDSGSQKECKGKHSNGNRAQFVAIDKTLVLDCDVKPEYCSEYRCSLPQFKPQFTTIPFTLNLALIPFQLKHMDFKTIILKLNSKIKVEENKNIVFETNIASNEITTIFIDRTAIPKIDKWIIYVSSGIGILLLLITVIVLIKIGFFRRKKLEEINEIKNRMSSKPDINQNDIPEQFENNNE